MNEYWWLNTMDTEGMIRFVLGRGPGSLKNYYRLGRRTMILLLEGLFKKDHSKFISNRYLKRMVLETVTRGCHCPTKDSPSVLDHALVAEILRDIFGNPFLLGDCKPTKDGKECATHRKEFVPGKTSNSISFSFCPKGRAWREKQRESWVAWNDGAIRKIAQEIYDEQKFEDLPLLADALEDAICTDENVLAHLRLGRKLSFKEVDELPVGTKVFVKWGNEKSAPKAGGRVYRTYRILEDNRGAMNQVDYDPSASMIPGRTAVYFGFDLRVLNDHRDTKVYLAPCLHMRGCWVLDLILGYGSDR